MSFTAVENMRFFYHKVFVGGPLNIGNKKVWANTSGHDFRHKNKGKGHNNLLSASFSGLERLIAAPYLMTYLGALKWYNEFSDHDYVDDKERSEVKQSDKKKKADKRSAALVVTTLTVIPILPVFTVLAMVIALLETVILGLASPFLFAGAAIKDCVSAGCATT